MPRVCLIIAFFVKLIFRAGTLKTLVLHAFILSEELVSIPHRYAENLRPVCNCRGVGIGFQFLIGTLKTQGYGRCLLVRNRVSIPHRYAENGQPFYTGASPAGVSIPHRYAENPGEPIRSGPGVGFQFLIGTLKTTYAVTPFDDVTRFNSS